LVQRIEIEWKRRTAQELTEYWQRLCEQLVVEDERTEIEFIRTDLTLNDWRLTSESRCR
tara:strand:+ start:87 stop:263 length:177 start_codon:yes stop_codon:yes gene_type:complete